MVYEALVAAQELEARGIHARVLNMHTIKPLDVDAVVQAARQTGALVTAEEHSIVGGLGAAVAEKWGFSPQMVEIIRNHHLPEESVTYDLETSLVYLADTLCMMMGIGVGSDGLAYRFRRDVVEKLGFSDRDFQEVMAGFGEKLRKVEDLLGNA